MDNPNEYNDEMYSKESVDLDSAIQGIWEAGASLDEIEEIIKNGLDNAGLKVEVTLFVEEI